MPNTIVILRDGLSDNELDQALNFELPQIVETCRDPTVVLELLGNDSSGSESSSSQEADYAPEIYFLVVQKRINQRMFLIEVSSRHQYGTNCAIDANDADRFAERWQTG